MLNDVCYFILGLTGVFLIIYFVVELNYFLRSLICVILAKFFKKRKHILDETTITGICIFNDVDYFLDHMNNARYTRELDFAKLDFYQRTGLYNKVIKKKGSIFIGATTIRYRRLIKIFTKYQITTKIIYWDNQNIYIEHKFITKSGFINTIALCRIRIINVDVEEIMKDLILENNNISKKLMDNNLEAASAVQQRNNKEKPEIPPEVEKWNESNQISSQKLRENDNNKIIIIENCDEVTKV